MARGAPQTSAPIPLSSLGPQAIVQHRLQASRYSLEAVRSHEKWDRDLVALRRELIAQLDAAGYSPSQIGRVLNRDHTTILYQLGRRRGRGPAA